MANLREFKTKIKASSGIQLPAGAGAGLIAVSDATGNISWQSGAPPGGAAGGDLSGTYPNPQIAAGVILDADVNAAAAIAESKLSLATDAAAGTGSRRTIGTGALQACAGNDARLSDARAPTGAAGGDLSGTYPNPTVANQRAHDARVAATANVVITGPGLTIDGVTMAAGDRVLLTAQTTVAQNGLWVYNGSAVAMTRPVDWASAAVKTPGQAVAVALGTSARTVWITTAGCTVDTSDPTFKSALGVAARYGNATTQAVAANTVTAMVLGTKRYDTDTIGSTANRLTCKTPGVYAIGGVITWPSNATGMRATGLRLNGTLVLDWQHQPGGSNVGRSSAATQYLLAVNDFIELLGFQDSGVALTTVAVTAGDISGGAELWMARL